MLYDFAIPSKILQPYIKQYWAIETILPKGQEHSQRIIATGLPELTFYFGKRPTSDKRTLESNVLISGQQNDYYDLLITDHLSVFSITFQPNGLSQFLKFPVSELRNQTVAANAIDKSFLPPHVEDQLAEAKSFKKRVEIAEALFVKLIATPIERVDHERMLQSIQMIKSSKGSVSIDALASNACLSRKQFERKFLAYIGISPKQFLKIIRFQYTLFLNQSAANHSLTSLAYEAGYYDQSHFINEIKELTGLTPKKLFAHREIITDFFS
jgi:AraC-like DNA-binding protein